MNMLIGFSLGFFSCTAVIAAVITSGDRKFRRELKILSDACVSYRKACAARDRGDNRTALMHLERYEELIEHHSAITKTK